MKVVSDYEVDFSSGGAFTCCWSHVLECHDPAKIGDRIECDECGATLILQQCKDGVVRWRAISRG